MRDDMAKATRKRQGEVLRGVFEVLWGQPDGLPAKEVIRRVEELVPPTEFEDTRYEKHPNFRRYDKMVRFRSIGAVKAGWLVKNKGQWSLTEAGKQAYRDNPDPEEFAREAWRLYKRWRDSQPPPEEEEAAGEDEDAADASATLEEAQENAWREIEDHLAEMNPYDFQAVVSGLLEGMGYHVEHDAPPGPDGGIDIVAHTDPLGVKGPRIKVQVKRRADRLNVDAMRAFMAVLAEGDVGLFVSTGGFTKDAEQEARKQEKRRLMLLDLNRFFDLWVEHYSSIPESARRLLPLRPVYYLDLGS